MSRRTLWLLALLSPHPVVAQAPGPLHSELDARWGFGSPLPYTAIIGQWDHRTYSPADNTQRSGRIEALGWRASDAWMRFAETVAWYRANRGWWEPLVPEAERIYSDQPG